MHKRYEELLNLVTDEKFKDDFMKFYDQNNQAAGTRIRVHGQKIKKLLQDIRLEVQDMKNNS